MAISETTICNLALGKLGGRRIMSLDDASAEARQCKLAYEPTRDEALRAHRWNFAARRANLSRLADPPPFGWRARYQLPSDCLRVLQLNGYEDYERPDLWEVEGRQLLTDRETAQVKYVARVTDATQFDALFVKALACKLAAEIAKALTGSSSIPGDLLTEYERITGPLARTADAMEARPKRKLPWVESELVRTRRG